MNRMIDVIKEDSRYEYMREDIGSPLYQFNRSTYWIDKPKSNGCIDEDIDKLNYTISWNETSFQTNSLPTNNILCIAYKKYENNNDYILVPEQNDIITSQYFSNYETIVNMIALEAPLSMNTFKSIKKFYKSRFALFKKIALQLSKSTCKEMHVITLNSQKVLVSDIPLAHSTALGV